MLVTLKNPATALKYEKGRNEKDVAKFFKANGRQLSYDTNRGFLHLYGDGSESQVRDGQWAVLIGGGVIVLDAEEFEDHFTAADETTLK